MALLTPLLAGSIVVQTLGSATPGLRQMPANAGVASVGRIPFGVSSVASRSFETSPLSTPWEQATWQHKPLIAQSRGGTTSWMRRPSWVTNAFVDAKGGTIAKQKLEKCAGSRQGSCNANMLERVCVQVLDGESTKMFGDKSYWDVVDEASRDSEVKANNGDSFCITMWKAAQAIERAGCENVHIKCEATDIQRTWALYADKDAFNQYIEGHPMGAISADKVRDCFKSKCNPPNVLAEQGSNGSVIPFMGLAVVGAALGAILVAFVAQRRRTAHVSVKPVLG